ncbi:hypothetical protein DESUT3_21540 [Desulfuromonas versatilis]|uniref:Rieske domain-containing protein n=1 Tax=Desulfuromonas versatilis TaxID=2802975 RepID=A0ABM8HQ27_9BACT|nr:Rieske 2Fe-2S domain-containing protein [Desulfuromonas versatilis]BCR05085.1 hypothetical protein DESUT3_21540 [Desulfuromonas versatilis]
MKRRDWLVRTLSWGFGGTALGMLGWMFGDVWLAAGRFSTAHWTRLTDADTISGEAVVPFPAQRVALVRREALVGAVSLECTHLGCLVNVMDQGFYCPCHGSEFGPLGEVWSGPAPTPLQWHEVRVSRGQLWIHSGQKLDAPHWVQLPPSQQNAEV